DDRAFDSLRHGSDRDKVDRVAASAPQLVGPADFAWGARAEDYGSVAYVISDGGRTAPPPDGIVRTAKVLRVEL
ncbi:MAG TPA: hypothetical protein VHO95_02735, partial [Candidatus Dormibacteraeota bacterium]|nr:hypothetical protein [Candidatus Dormibacteraeota bacterium]